MFGYRSKTEIESKEAQAIQRAIKIKEALKEKELHPFPEPDEDEADPYVCDEETNLEFDDSIKTQEEYAEIKIEKLEKHLQKYANPFPIEVFPEPIRLHIIDAEKCLNFPKELYATSMLSAIAGAIRNNFQLLFKNELTSVSMLYLLIVGRPGINKSSPLERALKPLFDKEKEYNIDYKQAYALYKKQKNEGIADVIEPVCQSCLINDATMEATQEILAENPLGLTLYYDEFMGFLKSLNKYRSGDDIQKYLSIWSGKPIKINRKGKPSVYVHQPFLNNVGTIQTDVLVKYIHEFKENNGFIDRLLFALCDSKSNRNWNTKILNREWENQYRDILKRIIDYEAKITDDGTLKPRLLTLSPKAFDKILRWQNENTILSENTDNMQIAGFYNKLDIYLLRFTLIITVLDYAYQRPSVLKLNTIKMIITEPHVKAAIRIAEYFRVNSKSIIEFVSQKVQTKHYDDNFMKFYKALPAQFDTQQALFIGKKQELSERTVYNYLKFDFIKNTARGKYEKRHYSK